MRLSIDNPIWIPAKLIGSGIQDSISIHKTLPLLLNNSGAFENTLRIFGANIVILLGSVAIFEYGIVPGLSFLKQKSLSNTGIEALDGSPSLIDQLAFMLFHSLWLTPMWIICYVCSTMWYQDLADCVFKHNHKLPRNSTLQRSVANNTYATIVWVFVFIEVQLFMKIIPTLGGTIISSLQSDGNLIGNNDFIQLVSLPIAHITIFMSKVLGWALMSILYGWYGFDPHWISSGIEPDDRFNIIENHWMYFLGFGLPLVVVINLTSFFVGYGSFLALFPFWIMRGGTSEYARPYNSIPNVSKYTPRVAVFGAPKYLTLMLLRYFKKKNRITKGPIKAPLLKKDD